MKPSIVDTHAHLEMKAFTADRQQVIARARDGGVSTIITIGTDIGSNRKAIELAAKHPEILASIGFHPHEAARVKKEDIARLAETTHHPRVVALGEMGLDYYRNRSPREAQIEVLEWQLELAARRELPVIIHCRQAEPDMLPLLRDWTSRHKESGTKPGGVIHCFSGNVDTAEQYLDMGFFLAFGAYLSYPTSRHLPDVIRHIPTDRLVVETDCPFLPPQRYRGQRNEPAYLPLTVALIAEIRGVTPEEIARRTTENARRLFRIGHETERQG